MSRWWDKYGFRTILIAVALVMAILVKKTQASVLSEVYYFIVSPFQSQTQLVLEDRLTNARVLELEQQVTELTQQNQQLKQLIAYNQTKAESITAAVIARNSDRWWQRVTLGKGSQDGVQPGYIVTGIGGLIGRVTHVTPHTSQVLLISDVSSKVGAILSRNRQLGYIQGQENQTVIMHFFNQVADIKPGDTIATSNLSKLYPPGLPIGKVKSKSQSSSPTLEALTEIVVELTAPIDVLEWVSIEPFQPAMAIKS
ncbi:rod shape-determining protein MreC [Chondrocystis sp. NIES-4102]|nr:rod shape-determining protein MreC [Chondrocystis sp. NIES-4102]